MSETGSVYQGWWEGDSGSDELDERDDIVEAPFRSGAMVCAQCFEEIDPDAVVRCFTCRKRLHAKCATDVLGDLYCMEHDRAALRIALEDAVLERDRYRHALVFGSAVLAGMEVGDIDLATLLTASKTIVSLRKKAEQAAKGKDAA